MVDLYRSTGGLFPNIWEATARRRDEEGSVA
jgi:hypothetical protein